MRALSTASTGMAAQQLNVEVISNNIANMNTVGFKRQRAEFQDLIYQDMEKAGAQSSDTGTVVPTGIQIGSGVKTGSVYRITSQGSLTQTSNKLDVAIQGRGYLQVQMPSGETAYTRAGNLSVNNTGQIVTDQGYPVLPQITIPPDATDISISASGQVQVTQPGNVAPAQVGQFQLATFVNEAGLEAMGDNLFSVSGASGTPVLGNPGATGFGTLMQGYTEASNVDAVTEITALISAQRAYEMNSKVISTADQMLATTAQVKLMRRLGTFAMGLALAALPLAALAGPPAELREDVAVAGGRVTLGDLFFDAGAAAGIVVARMQPGQMVVLDATQVQIIARSNGVDWGNPAGVRRIMVQSSAQAPAADLSRSAVETRKAVKGPAVLAYLHSLNAGDIVRAQDLTWSREAVGGSDAPRDAESVIGMAVRRPLREGDSVSLRDLSTPMVIKKDDVISVSFSQGGLNLTLTAKALSDAAVGQSVAVLNPSSKKVIEAMATGRGAAVVGPQAEQLKAAGRQSTASSLSDPSRLALR